MVEIKSYELKQCRHRFIFEIDGRGVRAEIPARDESEEVALVKAYLRAKNTLERFRPQKIEDATGSYDPPREYKEGENYGKDELIIRDGKPYRLKEDHAGRDKVWPVDEALEEVDE